MVALSKGNLPPNSLDIARQGRQGYRKVVIPLDERVK